MLWTLLYESSARAEEVLLLNVPDLDTANRRAVMTRKCGARDVIVWQTGTARLLAGRTTGPVFLTDRKARPSVALVDVDPRTSRARLSYRRAAEVFEQHTTDLPGGPYTLHHSGLTHAAGDGASTPMLTGAVRAHLGAIIGQVRPGVGRGARPVAGRTRPRRAQSWRPAMTEPDYTVVQ